MRNLSHAFSGGGAFNGAALCSAQFAFKAAMSVVLNIPTSIELLHKLVAFPTVSRDPNLALIEFVRDYLEDLGAACRVTYDDERRKANLFATLGPAEQPGIVLSGHTDVVPVEGQRWDSDPFRLVERDGKLYGRGSADMKSFIACALALAPEFAHRKLRVPLHFAFSYDEEVGCLGVDRMIADFAQAGIRPRSCIVGEPTLMRPVIAHKGRHAFRCTVRGLSCHSAYAPRGVNAVEAAGEAVAFLKQMARRRRDQGPYDRGFDIAHTTVHVGTIRGGIALNVVPSECVFEFEFRHLPGDDPDVLLAEFTRHVCDHLEPEMKAVDPDSGFDIRRLSALPVLDNDERAEVVQLARALCGGQSVDKVSFGTEGPHFQGAGIPSIVCGPGSIEQAHKPNEFVTLDQIARCEQFLRRLIERVSE